MATPEHDFHRVDPNSESGQSLMLALVVLLALSISIAGLFDFLMSNQRQFNRDTQNVRALSIAEAGLNNGLATVTKADPLNAVVVGSPAGSLSGGPISLDQGKFSYSATKQQAPNCPSSLPTCWVVTADGTSPSGQVTHRLQQTIGWITKTTTTSIDETPVYGFGLFISNQPGDANCFAVSGTAVVKANIWFNGSYCPNGNVDLLAAQDNKYTVYIGGNYLGTNNTHIGSSASKFAQATIVGICKRQNTVQTCSDSPNSNVYAYPPYLKNSSPLKKPDVNAQQVYTYGNGLGKPGDPTVNWNAPICSTGSFTFDNNTVMGGNMPETTLFSGSTFSCTVKDSSGNTVGTLAWDNTTKTLTVNGTIFIDGDINVPNGTVNYKGNGTIYVNGSLHGGQNVSGTNICGPENTPLVASGYGCPGTWNYPTTTPPASGTGSLMFVFINPWSVATPVNLQGSNHEWDVTLFVVKGFTSNGGTYVLGPILADGGSMAGNVGLVIPPSPPIGAPTTVVSSTTSAAWGVTAGNWMQLK